MEVIHSQDDTFVAWHEIESHNWPKAPLLIPIADYRVVFSPCLIGRSSRPVTNKQLTLVGCASKHSPLFISTEGDC
jgi:hypothetical protein